MARNPNFCRLWKICYSRIFWQKPALVVTNSYWKWAYRNKRKFCWQIWKIPYNCLMMWNWNFCNWWTNASLENDAKVCFCLQQSRKFHAFSENYIKLPDDDIHSKLLKHKAHFFSWTKLSKYKRIVAKFSEKKNIINISLQKHFFAK